MDRKHEANGAFSADTGIAGGFCEVWPREQMFLKCGHALENRRSGHAFEARSRLRTQRPLDPQDHGTSDRQTQSPRCDCDHRHRPTLQFKLRFSIVGRNALTKAQNPRE
jgi:hypothetical protein